MKAAKETYKAGLSTQANPANAPVQQAEMEVEHLVCGGRAEEEGWRHCRVNTGFVHIDDGKLITEVSLGDLVAVRQCEESLREDREVGYNLPLSLGEITRVEEASVVVNWFFCDNGYTKKIVRKSGFSRVCRLGQWFARQMATFRNSHFKRKSGVLQKTAFEQFAMHST